MTEKTTIEEIMEGALGIARGFAGGENCVVSHPDAGGLCGRPGIGLVWNLPFCEVHAVEAEAAALEEIGDDTQMQLEALLSAENARSGSNRLLLHTLEQAQALANKSRTGHTRDQDEALRAAYPPLEGRIDPDILAFDYEAHYEGDGPVDWWTDAQYLLCRFMREAQGKGLPELVRELEPLRERASAQLVQAEDDYDRRYVTPRRAKREAARG